MSLISLSQTATGHGLAQLKCKACGVDTLEDVRGLTHLTAVDASDNVLTSFAEIVTLRHLVRLDLSGNRIVEVPNLPPPALVLAKKHAPQPGVWEDGAKGAGDDEASPPADAGLAPRVRRAWPALASLNLSRNAIQAIPATFLYHCRALRDLDVSDNRLGDLPDGLDTLPLLRRLRANGNALRSLRRLAPCRQLEELSVANNQLRSLGDVPPGLTWLDASHNPVHSLQPLQACTRLGTLVARHTLAGGSARALRPLEGLPLLTSVDVRGVFGARGSAQDGPAAEGKQDEGAADADETRARALAMLPGLLWLNGAPATAEERVHARAAHGGELEQRTANHDRWLPDAPLRNPTVVLPATAEAPPQLLLRRGVRQGGELLVVEVWDVADTAAGGLELRAYVPSSNTTTTLSVAADEVADTAAWARRAPGARLPPLSPPPSPPPASERPVDARSPVGDEDGDARLARRRAQSPAPPQLPPQWSAVLEALVARLRAQFSARNPSAPPLLWLEPIDDGAGGAQATRVQRTLRGPSGAYRLEVAIDDDNDALACVARPARGGGEPALELRVTREDVQMLLGGDAGRAGQPLSVRREVLGAVAASVAVARRAGRDRLVLRREEEEAAAVGSNASLLFAVA